MNFTLRAMFIAVLLACGMVATAQNGRGDVNGDGTVDISDVNLVINMMLGKTTPASVADVNGDTRVDISDVNIIINIMLGKVVADPTVTTYTVNGVSFKMITVDGGTFTMGANEGDANAFDDEYPNHQVTLSTYSIGETEVTQELWEAVMGENPSHFMGEQKPVGMVSWNDCQVFVAKLKELTGKDFRLPTEAEWEFAARGGNKSQGYLYAGSDDVNEVGWWHTNVYYAVGSATTMSVAQLAPNELGLYDMSGNAWEFCQDWYGEYSNEAQTNPVGPDSGTYRCARGGGIDNGSRLLRISQRDWDLPDDKYPAMSLRLAL